MSSWVDEITDAMEALGGNATYTKLYKYIRLTTARKLTTEWKASVRRTIEDHSSDSDNFRGTDLFVRLGRGHWGLRTPTNEPSSSLFSISTSNDPDEANRDERMTENMVFVREHWRRFPGDGDQVEQIEAIRLDLDRMTLSNAWVTSTHIEFSFENGAGLTLPISNFRELEAVTIEQRQQVTVSKNQVVWPLVPLKISLARLLLALMEQQ